MRFTFILAILTLPGCFHPRIADGGFACDPSDPTPCPEGLHCRDPGSGFVCTASLVSAPSGPGASDMAMAPVGNGGDLALPMASGNGDLALPPGAMDLAMPAASCGVANLVINEVQTHGVTASDEWIEIFNPCASALTISGTLVYRAAMASADSTTLATLSSRAIAARGYFLVANAGYGGAADVKPFQAGGLADAGGGVALRDGGGQIVNAMAWGTAANGFAQGNPASPSGSSGSMARTPNGSNSHHDDVDFALAPTPTPGASN